MSVAMSRRLPSLHDTPFAFQYAWRFFATSPRRRGQMSQQLPVMLLVRMRVSKSARRTVVIGWIRMRSRALPATSSSVSGV